MCMPVQRRTATATHLNHIPGGDLPASRIYSPELVASRQPSDDALARAAARGVMGALGVLYERHNRRVYALEASSYFSRSGPRLITGIEALAKLFQPAGEVSREAEPAIVPIAATATRSASA